MQRKTGIPVLVGVVFSALFLVGALMWLLSAPNVQGATPIFSFDKTISKPSVRSGDIFTVTLRISPTAALAETRQFTITDPIQNTALWEIVPGEVRGNGASYSSTINAVVWLGTASPNTIATVTFQMHIKSVGNITAPTVVTNTAYVSIYDPQGSLSGSLPGSLVTDIGYGNLGAQATVTLIPYKIYLPIIRR